MNNPTAKKAVIKRMNYLIGHLNGVKNMIEADKYCVDVIKQNQAVVAAIHKVNQMILKDHLDHCVARAVESKSKRRRNKVFKEIVEVFEASE